MRDCRVVLVEEVDTGLGKRYRFRVERGDKQVIVNVGGASLEEAVERAGRLAEKYLGC